ncbi:transmembrane protein [Cystoisospora suis]|uniref:Transmembrane protein n=1 Tax=Cystoisospora suis TaxID=483139 RepID=A0A2C6L6W2_9APIC|nr:transmembrane protein [Cystoisospora suis]
MKRSSHLRRRISLGSVLSCLFLSVLFFSLLASSDPDDNNKLDGDSDDDPTFKYVTPMMLSQFLVIFAIALTTLVGLCCLVGIDVPEIYSNRTLDINKEY